MEILEGILYAFGAIFSLIKIFWPFCLPIGIALIIRYLLIRKIAKRNAEIEQEKMDYLAKRIAEEMKADSKVES